MPPALRNDTAPQNEDADMQESLCDALHGDDYEVVEINADQADAELMALIAGQVGNREGWRASP